MTTYYCPRCWQIIQDPSCCPACGVIAQEGDLVERYIAALRHSEPTRAMLAVHVLGQIMREPRAVGPLLALVGVTPDAYLAREAIRALGHFSDSRIAPALSRILADPHDSIVRRLAAVESLAEVGGPEAERALRGAADDPSPTIRAQARRALDALAGQAAHVDIGAKGAAVA